MKLGERVIYEKTEHLSWKLADGTYKRRKEPQRVEAEIIGFTPKKILIRFLWNGREEQRQVKRETLTAVQSA